VLESAQQNKKGEGKGKCEQYKNIAQFGGQKGGAER